MGQLVMNRFRRAEGMPGGQAKGAISPRFFWFVAGPIIGISLVQVVPMFIHTTPVRPYHLSVMGISLLVALVVAVFGVIVVLSEKSVALWKRVGLSLFVFVASFIAVCFIASQFITSLIEMQDFPAGKTTSATEIVPITQAYQTHGRASGDYIRTPYGHFRVRTSDYGRLKTQRPVAFTDVSADKVTINGYYCAKLPVQTAGNAVRVMMGAEDYVPTDSLELCPVIQIAPSATPAVPAS